MAHPALNEILEHLKGVRGPDANGWYTAFCPFHDDQRRPNLRFTENGFRCLACNEKGSILKLADKLGVPRTDSVENRPQTTYDYRDERGNLLFQVVRLHSPKDFRQRRPDGNGGWHWDLKGIRRVLYRLPGLIAADPNKPVSIAEGEKDADRLIEAGLVATTNPGGAGKWRREYGAYLRDRKVLILPDNDSPGLAHAQQVALALKGIAAEIRLLHLPDLPAGGDVSDWLDAGGTVESLLSLAEKAPLWPPAATHPTVPTVPTFSAPELMALKLPEPKWAVPSILSEGVSILGGKPKMGKSWLALNLAVAVASGGRALSTVEVEQGDALYLALEDTKRRLQGRLNTILDGQEPPPCLELANAWPRMDDGGLEALEDWLSRYPQARLVIIDTLARVRPVKKYNDSAYDFDYESLGGLKNLADRFGVAILVIHHLRKLGSSDPVDAISGTLGLTGAADGVLVLKRERGQHDAALFVTGRDVDEQELALVWHAPSALWAIVGQAEDYRLSKERAEVMAMFEKEGNCPLTPTQAADLLGKNKNTVKKLMWQMSRAGQLETRGGQYWPPRNGNLGNLGNSGNLGDPGNQAVTTVTDDDPPLVTAADPKLNLEEPSGYPVTRVTAHVQTDIKSPTDEAVWVEEVV